jgi:hypothetical protein
VKSGETGIHCSPGGAGASFDPTLMNSNLPLTGAHLRTYQTIFQHPISHNLGWQEVHALFRHVGEMDEEPNGNFKVTRNGRTLILHPSRTKDVAETDQLMAMRHFLRESEGTPPPEGDTHARCLLVIDHRQARIFRSGLNGTEPKQILPHPPQDYFRQARNAHDFSRGQEKPEPNSYFAPVAAALAGADQILIFGTGTGMSSEMDQFTAWLKTHDAQLAKRIVGTLVVDEQHLTESQLLAKARDFYDRPVSPPQC